MESESEHWLFRIQLEHTPSANDPIGAPEFYRVLGIVVVAWGRLENHFLACILAILAADETRGLSRKLPNAWPARAKIWTDAFDLFPSLRPHRGAANKFLADISDVAKHRNRLVHGLWGPFCRPTSTEPIGIGLAVLNHKKGTTNGVEFWRGTVGIAHLREVAQEADRLNIELQELSSILTAAQPPIPSDVRRP